MNTKEIRRYLTNLVEEHQEMEGDFLAIMVGIGSYVTGLHDAIEVNEDDIG